MGWSVFFFFKFRFRMSCPGTPHLNHLIFYCNGLKWMWRRCSEILISSPLHLHTAKPKMPPTENRARAYLNGGVIFIHKVVLDELDGECALAHATSSHYHQLVLRHVCCCGSPHACTVSAEKTERRKEQVRQTGLYHRWNIHSLATPLTWWEHLRECVCMCY